MNSLKDLGIIKELEDFDQFHPKRLLSHLEASLFFKACLMLFPISIIRSLLTPISLYPVREADRK